MHYPLILVFTLCLLGQRSFPYSSPNSRLLSHCPFWIPIACYTHYLLYSLSTQLWAPGGEREFLVHLCISRPTLNLSSISKGLRGRVASAPFQWGQSGFLSRLLWNQQAFLPMGKHPCRDWWIIKMNEKAKIQNSKPFRSGLRIHFWV